MRCYVVECYDRSQSVHCSREEALEAACELVLDECHCVEDEEVELDCYEDEDGDEGVGRGSCIAFVRCLEF